MAQRLLPRAVPELEMDPLTPTARRLAIVMASCSSATFLVTSTMVIYLTVVGFQALRSKETMPQNFYNMFLVYYMLIGIFISSTSLVMNW